MRVCLAGVDASLLGRCRCVSAWQMLVRLCLADVGASLPIHWYWQYLLSVHCTSYSTGHCTSYNTVHCTSYNTVYCTSYITVHCTNSSTKHCPSFTYLLMTLIKVPPVVSQSKVGADSRWSAACCSVTRGIKTHHLHLIYYTVARCTLVVMLQIWLIWDAFNLHFLRF